MSRDLAHQRRLVLSHLAADRGDFALQVSDPGFAGVISDNLKEQVRLKVNVSGLQAVFGQLLGHQVLLGDFNLFFGNIAGQFHDLHPVAQGRGNGIQDIGGGDEHDGRQVKVHLQIVV